MCTQDAGVKSGKVVAPYLALVAVANEKGAFGSPSTAVDHFTLLSFIFPIGKFKPLHLHYRSTCGVIYRSASFLADL